MKAAGIALLFLALAWSYAYPSDGSQWDAADPDLAAWYRSLMAPDVPNMSCCGEADAYFCDDTFATTENGKAHVFCKITDDRPDAPRGRPHIDVGTVIEIPPEKMMRKRENPTGHSIVFLGRGGNTYCFIMDSGT